MSAILSQNPKIHAEGNSAVCQLMWDLQQSCETSCNEQLRANYRQEDQDVLVSSIPKIYYRNVQAEHIVDKCRSWTLPANMEMLRRYITDDPKVIVMIRPLDEIVHSFVKLRKANGWTGDLESDLRVAGSEPIMRSMEGVEFAKETNKGEFIFVEYADLVRDPQATIERIYSFCGWEPFQHSFTNVVNKHPEDDSVYGLAGMHDIRPVVG